MPVTMNLLLLFQVDITTESRNGSGLHITCDLLGSFPRIRASMDRFAKINISYQPLASWLLFLFSASILTGIGIWPNLLFPALRVAPLLLVVSIQAIAGYKTIFTPVKTGDWTHLWLMAVSALVCGFFWKLWNFSALRAGSLPSLMWGVFDSSRCPSLALAATSPLGWNAPWCATVYTK